jgi:RNA polymerase sigma-70 factor (ECF subfamily)
MAGPDRSIGRGVEGRRIGDLRLNVVHLLAVLVVMVTETRRADPPAHSANDADDALRILYAEHGQALLDYAERFTADRGRAEDIVQETFLRAWRQLPGLLDDERPVRAWLLRVARRLLIDAARAARARPTLADNTQSTEPADDGGLSQLLDQTILIDAMQQLSPAHQQIVVETFFLGTPMHLTASRLGVPAGTARSRLHYALSQLRRQLESGCLAA